MKDKLKNNRILFFFLALVLFVVSCESGKEKQQDMSGKMKDTQKVYYCPMDTEVVQNKPGICPKCDMDLELKSQKKQENTGDIIYRPVNEAVLSTARTIKAQMKSVPLTLKVSGYITYDLNRIQNISSRVEGRIEKLYVRSLFETVKKDQLILEIFSHEILTGQKEYLLLKETEPESSDLLNASYKKLLLLGMTVEHINHLKASDHVHPTTKVYSPYTGYVIETSKNEQISESGMGAGMEASTTPILSKVKNKELPIREGAYLKKGETIFTIVNTDIVWGVFEIYSNQLSILKLGKAVEIHLENSDETIIGKVDFIEPYIKEGNRTARFRVYLENKKQHFKIGNLLTAKIEAVSNKGWWIPQTAIIDLGNDKVVFVKKDGAFITRKVTTGASTDNLIEIVAGLNKAEEIAEHVQFMVDSESFIKATND